MSHSAHKVGFVLVYDNALDRARWMTMAQATLLRNACPTIEIISEPDANYEAVAKLAGPQPEVYVMSTEDYNANTAEPESPLPDDSPGQ